MAENCEQIIIQAGQLSRESWRKFTVIFSIVDIPPFDMKVNIMNTLKLKSSRAIGNAPRAVSTCSHQSVHCKPVHSRIHRMRHDKRNALYRLVPEVCTQRMQHYKKIVHLSQCKCVVLTTGHPKPHLLQAATTTAQETYEMSLEEVKAILQDTLWGTERGLSADSDTRAEINELISQLEAKNPTPQPNEALDKLDGTWKLAYTSNSELVALLALGKLPLVTVGDITQTVVASSQTVENRVQISAPFSQTSLAATASFEIRSPKLLQVAFQEGQIATPQLLADFELPASIDVMGQPIDMTPLQSLLKPLDGPLRSAVAQLGSLLSSAPDLKFPINTSASPSTWLLNTYVDDDLRVTRGDGGSVFVLMKEPLIMLPPAPDEEDDGSGIIMPISTDTTTTTAAAVAAPVADDSTDDDTRTISSNVVNGNNGSSASSSSV